MLDKIYVEINFGKVELKLKEIMDEKEISISKMSGAINTRYGIVKKYYNNDCYYVDLNLLAKFCYVLNCHIEDILEYNKSNDNVF